MRVLLLASTGALWAGCGLLLDTSPPADPVPDGGPQCFSDDDCTHDVCGGFERCRSGACVVVIDPLDCTDDYDCTLDECTPAGCLHTPDDGLCDPGKVCIPAEGGCVTPRTCSTPADCDDGDVCTAALDCVDSKCVVASGSTDLVCPPYDGCAVLGCDPAQGCVPVGTNFSLCAAFEDDLSCTLTECLPTGACVDVPSDAACDSSGVPNCLTVACLPGNDYADPFSGCVHRPNDSYCAASDPAVGCAESICAAVPGADSDGCLHQAVSNACSTASQTCNLDSGLCETVATKSCGDAGDCDDGDPCNGFETCNLGAGTCQGGTPPCQGSAGACTRLVCAPDLYVPGIPDSVCVEILTDTCLGVVTP